jgi:cellulose synthase/poly-beta-1,6-N-acetylglucosamine synthase-like glycosyltransferase
MQLFISLVFALLFIYVILFWYYRAAWKSIPDFEPPPGFRPATFLSVIVPARNEAKNITALLASLHAQTYPADLFEVIIIDDHSTDNTAAAVLAYPATNTRLLSLRDLLEDKAINSYKKKAIEWGIAQSRGQLIVTTDADCTVPEKWLETIAAFYEKYDPVFIAAPVNINCSKRFIEMFQALDFMTMQGITGAAVHKNLHSMCNGANLAYEKAAFYAVEGFKDIDHMASGDDMLLMHKMAKLFPRRICFLKTPDAIVNTTPVKTIKEFFNQRIRWASKADQYEDKKIMGVLLLVYLLNVTLFLMPLFALLKNPHLILFNTSLSFAGLWLLLVVLKTIAELLLLYPVAKFFGKQKMLLLFPLLQPFHILYIISAGWLGKFGSYHWKERKVK